jgi:hypothetical protein
MILALLGIALIVVPTAVLMSSLGDSVRQLITDVQENTLAIPAPPDAVATWPVVGDLAKLALGYQIFMGWVTACGEPEAARQEQDKPT